MLKAFARIVAIGLTVAIGFFVATPAAWAFCGFFTAKAETPLSNSTSRVVIARQGTHSVLTMQNNFEGDVSEFARIVPIPVIPTREQVRIGDNESIDRLDSFTSPRLAEYRDTPCRDEYQLYRVFLPIVLIVGVATVGIMTFGSGTLRTRLLKLVAIAAITYVLTIIALPSFLNQANKAKQFAPQQANSAVTIADQFAVGEYDVTLLSATESDGLMDWLQGNGYRVPAKANAMLQDYIQQGMKFFVVRVNLQRFQAEALGFLRPVVIEYDSSEFALPIRLGTLNATGDYQDVTVYLLTENTPVQLANYPTLPIPTDALSHAREPSGQELPPFTKAIFQDFYQAMFQKQYEQADRKVGFLEYAGPLGGGGKCDPCTVPPEEIAYIQESLGKLGVSWQGDSPQPPVMMTRIHVRYTADKFPEDLKFQEVDEFEFFAPLIQQGLVSRNGVFQGRYVIRQADTTLCLSGWRYHQVMRHAVDNLARLTGWSPEEIKLKQRSTPVAMVQ